jgi:hypothetical protein
MDRMEGTLAARVVEMAEMVREKQISEKRHRCAPLFVIDGGVSDVALASLLAPFHRTHTIPPYPGT